MRKEDGFYCYVCTRDPGVAAEARRSGLPATGRAGDREIFYAGPGGGPEFACSVVNDQGDYDVAALIRRAATGVEGGDHDSVVSVASPLDDGFACLADFYAIGTHYRFMDEDTFACSDDLFLVAALAGADLSRESLYEYLFFLSPAGERTWFDSVRRLLPGQGLRYNAFEHGVAVTGPVRVADQLARLPVTSLEESVRRFIEGTARTLDGARANVSISAGSDSRTVLAILRATGAPIHAWSFGSPGLVETDLIERLVRRFGLEWTLVDMSAFASAWVERFRRTLRATGGLLNPYRTHYEEFFGCMPAGEPVFEGVLGSQFLKGEMAVGSIIAPAHRAVAAGEMTVADAVDRQLADLPEEFRRGMAEYIADVHPDALVDVHTDAGAELFRRWGLEFFPGRIFAGMIRLPSKRRAVYQPLIAPSIVAAVGRLDLGIARDIAIRRDNRGPIAVLEAEAHIVRAIDPAIYRSVIDRGVSFREVLELPDPARRLVKKWRNGLSKIRYRGWTRGQVENDAVFRETAAYAQSAAGRHPLVDTLLEGKRPKEAANLAMILETLDGS